MLGDVNGTYLSFGESAINGSGCVCLKKLCLASVAEESPKGAGWPRGLYSIYKLEYLKGEDGNLEAG